LIALSKDFDPYTRAFAAKGLGALKDRAAVPALMPLLSSGAPPVVIEVVRALGKIADPAGVAPLLKLVQTADTEPHLRLEAISALGGFRGASMPGLLDTLLDLIVDKNPSVRAAALRSVASLDPDGFVPVLSGLDPDAHWNVRATLADILGSLPPEAALPRLT